MQFIRFAVLFVVVSQFYIEPTTCALPASIQNLELDDITSLWEKFPAIIGKIKEAVNRFRCPKGWRRLGGSCYYLSNLTSTPTEANETCNALHSNHSNLMQIRNTIELFYAAHVLTKNNLSALMVDLDPMLFKGKKITDILMEDQGRWQRMKEKFREMRVRYYKIKEKILNELQDAGLRISRRSKKMKQSVRKHSQKFTDDHVDPDVYDDYEDHTEPHNSTEVEEYEYDDIDAAEDEDEFDHLDDIQGMCDQIDWNVIHNDSTVYLLTTYLLSDKVVCSLSDVEADAEYEHVCEYVLDFCFANIVCGKHGHCVNTLSGFKCSCSFLYGGVLCERISKQGTQILIGFGIIIFLYGLSFKPIRWALVGTIKALMKCCKYGFKARRRQIQAKKIKAKEDKQQLVPSNRHGTDVKVSDGEITEAVHLSVQGRRQTIVEEIMEFILPRNVDPLRNPNKRDLIRVCWVGGLSVFFLSLLFSVTTFKHFSSFKYDITDETKLDMLVNDTTRLLAQCEKISDYKMGNLIFFPVALSLILIFSWSIKREKRCPDLCDGRPGLIAPIEPFRTTNRFTTAAVFGILAFEVLKIFEELLFSSANPLDHGVLIELLIRIAVVILVGLRYYPVLASLQLRNIATRFFVCLYMLADIIYAIIREGSCMGFLPLSGFYSALEEAKLRVELGTWFIVYGLIKNTPHFIFLSYIGAELWVRFAYDSIYVPVKKKQSIWTAPVVQHDESQFAKYYVQKLFRRNLPTTRTKYSTKANIDKLEDHEHEAELQQKANQSRVRKFFDSIYQWDDDFRFTTMATCTYTVAVVFLYYLACTFVFLYISRTTGHISFIRYYIESTLNIELKGVFSLRLEIIISAVLTVLIYGFQLYVGIQNYKKHRKDLYKGIYEDVPSAANFKPNAIASKSVHYSGFLVGYMAWGFVICFHLIFLILSLIRVISLRLRYVEFLLAFTVPVLVVYLLKMSSTSSAGKFFFIQDMDEKLNLKNRKTYAIFVYFNFFADCFLGIASCIIRLIKATFLNVVYMARLDCSFLGRPLEKFDLGFAAYVSYLHMEVTHTNPIMLAFCYSMYDEVVKRRPNQCYDDECCIAPSELDDNVTVVQEKVKTRRQNGTPQKAIVAKKKVVPSGDDEEQGLSVRETKAQKKSPSPPSNSDKGSQKSKPRKPSIDNDIDEEAEEDGGPPTPEISTISRLIPERQPVLPEPSAPIPEAPPRRDLPPEENADDDDDDDDDGGRKPPSISTISRIIPEQAPVLLPLQESLPPPIPRRQDLSEDDDDDDDGGVDPKTIAKQKQEAEEKRKKKAAEKTKKKPQRSDDDDDDDGGVSKQKQIAAEKKARELEKKKKDKERRKAKASEDNDDDDDDGVPMPQASTKKKKPVEKTSKVEIVEEEDEDADGGRRVKTYDTVKMIMPGKQPVLDRSATAPSEPLLASYDTVGRMVPHVSKDFGRKKEEGHYDTIPTDEERAARGSAVYSPPSYAQASKPADLSSLRTISYRQAQQSSPPVTQRRPTTSSTPSRQSNANDDSSHYSEITSDAPAVGVINRSYSHTGSIRSTSNHSIKQASKQSSQYTLKEEQQTEESTVETEEEEEEDEEEESDEEEQQPLEKPLRAKQTALGNTSTAYSTLAHIVNPEEARKMEKLKKRKQARFRWFLAYTILNNYHLFDLRKQAQSRLALLRIQRSNLIDEQHQQTAVVVPVSQPVSPADVPGLRLKRMLVQPASPEVSASPEQRPSSTTHLLSVPGSVPIVDNFPQSPAERYIAVRSCMLYDVTAQQANTPRSYGSSVVSQPGQESARANLPTVRVEPPSEASDRSSGRRPRYQRQASLDPSVTTSNQFNGTPVFQAVPESNHSTADYPFANGSSITNFSTLRTQMSHAQHMQAWRQTQLKKAQKKHPHCYVYGPPPLRAPEEKVAAAAILTPQIIEPTSGNRERQPSKSPYQYPSQTKNGKEKRDKSEGKKSLRTTTALIHRRDSQGSGSNVTEV